MTRRSGSIAKRGAVITATAILASTALTVGVSLGVPEATAKPSKKQIAGLFDDWDDAVRTGDPAKVADLYASDSVLLPTLSNRLRTDRAGIVDYFEHFLSKKPDGEKVRTVVNVLDGNSAIDTGIYEFHVTDPVTGEKSTVPARYTYEYEKRDGKWLIVNHHSSKLPEG